MVKKSLWMFAVSSLLGLPLAALADTTGTVTVRPFGPAPALGLPVLIVLAVALGGIVAYRLRHHVVPRAVVGLLLAGFIGAAGIAYAVQIITVSNEDCAHVTTKTYDSSFSGELKNGCTTSIEVVEVDPCAPAPLDVLPDETGSGLTVSCEKGVVLDPGKSCGLPTCM